MESGEIVSSINSIYERYHTPLNVREHMRQVAGVAMQLCENAKESVDTQNIIAACLIHDLGNFVKMDFDNPQWVSLLYPEDQKRVAFLKEKKEEFLEKYGDDDSYANLLISKELGVNERVEFLFEHKELYRFPDSVWKNDLGAQIFFYSDLRVSPKGVVPMMERLLEFQKRYGLDKSFVASEHSRRFIQFAGQIEAGLFLKEKISPADITQESAKSYREEFGLI